MAKAHGWIIAAAFALMNAPLAEAQSVYDVTPQTACVRAMEPARQFKIDGIAPFAMAIVDRDYGIGVGCDLIALYRILPKEVPDRLPLPPGVSPSDWRRSSASRNPEYGKTATPRFAVRFLRGDPESAAWLASARWADQTNCAPILPAMKALEVAVAPRFTADGRKRDGGYIRLTMDGALNVFRADGMAWPDDAMDHRFDLEIRSNNGSPIANWIAALTKDIQPCLSETEPSFDE